MIEMFDPQYYLQMYRELQAIAPELEAQATRAAALLKVKERERRERIHRQYDIAIRKKIAKQTNKRLNTDERREQQRIAQKTFRERKKGSENNKHLQK